MTLSGFEFNPQLWSEEAYKVGTEIYKVQIASKCKV